MLYKPYASITVFDLPLNNPSNYGVRKGIVYTKVIEVNCQTANYLSVELGHFPGRRSDRRAYKVSIKNAPNQKVYIGWSQNELPHFFNELSIVFEKNGGEFIKTESWKPQRIRLRDYKRVLFEKRFFSE